MTFLAGLIVKSASLNNPTILVVTDRNDLDGQLYATFDSAREYLRQEPVNIESKDDLIASLSGKQYGGIVFSTIQKFMPKDKDARMEVLRTEPTSSSWPTRLTALSTICLTGLPLTSTTPSRTLLIGFTGTPISFSDRDTRGIFGDDISIYDIKKSIEDKSTVKLYYDKQKRELTTKQSAQRIDEAFEAATEFEEQAVRKPREPVPDCRPSSGRITFEGHRQSHGAPHSRTLGVVPNGEIHDRLRHPEDLC